MIVCTLLHPPLIQMCWRQRGGGTWIMIIPDVQLPLRDPRGGKVEVADVRWSVFALKEIDCSNHLWNRCGGKSLCGLFIKKHEWKTRPQRKKRSTASWYTSGLMLTITLDDFWREISRHEKVINHVVKLIKKSLFNECKSVLCFLNGDQSSPLNMWQSTLSSLWNLNILFDFQTLSLCFFVHYTNTRVPTEIKA